MLLLIDIGNTSTTTGIHDAKGTRSMLRFKTVSDSREIGKNMEQLNEYIQEQGHGKPEGAVICSVVPAAAEKTADSVNEVFGVNPLIVSHTLKTGLSFSIKNSATLGADRIANAVAARNLYKGSIIAADFGTATTLCLITDKGEYMGGSIMPGIGLSAACLAEKTSKLPEISIEMPDHLLGNDTAGNINTGILWGHIGAFEKIVSEIKKEYSEEVTVVATGGYSGMVTPYTEMIDYINSDLTLEGLRIIYELNAVS